MIEQALSWFKLRTKISQSDNFKQFGKVAISALEKQIPKKPIWNFGWLCPNCKENWVLHFENMPEENEKYCNRCGQALDWSDTE